MQRMTKGTDWNLAFCFLIFFNYTSGTTTEILSNLTHFFNATMGDLCRQPILLKDVRKGLVVVNIPRRLDRPFLFTTARLSDLGSEITFHCLFYVRGFQYSTKDN